MENDETTTDDAQAGAEQSGGGEEVKTVPYDRFQQVTRAKSDLEKQLEQLTAERDTFRQSAEEAKAAAEKAQADAASAAELRDLARYGIVDDLDADLARLAYSRLTGDDKPKTLADYVASKPEALLARIPSLRPQQKPEAEAKPAPEAPTVRAAPGSQPASRGDRTEQLRAANAALQRALRSGDPEQIKTARSKYSA